MAGEEEERRVLEQNEEFEQFAAAVRRHGTHFTKARHLAPRSESSKSVQAAGRRRFVPLDFPPFRSEFRCEGRRRRFVRQSLPWRMMTE